MADRIPDTSAARVEAIAAKHTEYWAYKHGPVNVEAFEAIDDLLAMLKEVSAALLETNEGIEAEYEVVLLARKVCDAS